MAPQGAAAPRLGTTVVECVISRDEHEYHGDTMQHWFILKRWGPSKECA